MMCQTIPKFDRKAVMVNKGYVRQCVDSNLRCMGRARRNRFLARNADGSPVCKDSWGHLEGRCRCASKSLVALDLMQYCDDGVYVDLGCGDSADTHIVRKMGWYSFGVDLYAPSLIPNLSEAMAPSGIFIHADICEHIPFTDGQVLNASCHAVIDLIPPELRPKFFSEVARILQCGGIFSFYVVRLMEGYGFTTAELLKLAADAGLERMKSPIPSVYLYNKP